MANNSATGGYVVPGTTQSLPGGLTLAQFIQTVIVGISGLPGPLVRPRWQVAPAKQPDLDVNWLAYQVLVNSADTNAYIWPSSGGGPDDNSEFQRQELLEIPCSFYGPAAMEYMQLVRDGFQIQQNLEALRAANMGFAETTEGRHVPDLVNERWIDRYEMTVYLRRQIQRTYPVLPILSAHGTIHSFTGNETYLQNWETPEPPEEP